MRWRPFSAGLFHNVLTQGRVAESLPWAQEMLDLAQVTGDADLLISGTRRCLLNAIIGRASSSRLLGTPTRCWTSTTTRGIAIWRTSSTTIPKLYAGVFASISTWMLGYPDRALRLSDETDAHARRRGHPFDLGYALTTGVARVRSPL